MDKDAKILATTGVVRRLFSRRHVAQRWMSDQDLSDGARAGGRDRAILRLKDSIFLF
jgi:hypothetical protein